MLIICKCKMHSKKTNAWTDHESLYCNEHLWDMNGFSTFFNICGAIFIHFWSNDWCYLCSPFTLFDKLDTLPLFLPLIYFQCNIHRWYHCCYLSLMARFNSLFLAFIHRFYFFIYKSKKKGEHMQRWFLLLFEQPQVLIDLLSFFVLN